MKKYELTFKNKRISNHFIYQHHALQLHPIEPIRENVAEFLL